MEVILFTIFAPLIMSIVSLFSTSEKFKAWAVTLGTFISALLATYAYLTVRPDPSSTVEIYNWIEAIGAKIELQINWSLPMGLLVAWLIAAISLYSVKYMEGDYRPGWYWFFFGFFATSMLIIVYAGNLWFLLVGWEGVGLASWALIGHWYRDEYDKWVGKEEKVAGVPYWWTPSKAGLRAILTVRFGDAFFLVAIALFYVLTGTVSLSGLMSPPALDALKQLGVVPLLFFALGPFTKSAQFPFHEWLLTAMTGPTSVSALIHAATMVKAGVYVLIVTAPIFAVVKGSELYFTVVMWVGVATALLATIIALTSMEFKLVLAGSTAANLGIIAAAVGAAGVVGLHKAQPLDGLLLFAFLHIVGHAVSKASLFMGFGAVIHEAGTRFLGEVGRLWRHMKITAVVMVLSMLSLVGIPPFVGYITKDLALEKVFEAGHVLGVEALAALLYILLFLTPIYGLRLIGLTFFHGKEPEEVHEAPVLMRLPYTALALATVVLGAYFASSPTPDIKFPLTEASVAVFLGFLTGFVLYIALPGFRSETLRPLWEFAYRRFYLPILYDGVFPWLYMWFAKFIFVVFDKGLFDGLYHNVLPGLFGAVSNWFRRLAMGALNIYLLYAIVGILITLLLLIVA